MSGTDGIGPCTTLCRQCEAGQASYPNKSTITVLPDGARLSTNFSTKLAPAQCCRGSGHVSKGGVIGFNSLQHFCFDFIHPGTYMWLLGALATHGNKAHKIALGTNTNLFELLDWCEAIVGSKEAINLVNLQHFTPG